MKQIVQLSTALFLFALSCNKTQNSSTPIKYTKEETGSLVINLTPDYLSQLNSISPIQNENELETFYQVDKYLINKHKEEENTRATNQSTAPNFYGGSFGYFYEYLILTSMEITAQFEINEALEVAHYEVLHGLTIKEKSETESNKVSFISANSYYLVNSQWEKKSTKAYFNSIDTLKITAEKGNFFGEKIKIGGINAFNFFTNPNELNPNHVKLVHLKVRKIFTNGKKSAWTELLLPY